MNKKKVLKLLAFQSFFLINEIGRSIISDTQDLDEINFFLGFYQYMLLDFNKRFGVGVELDMAKRDLKKKEYFVLYNYIMDYIEKNKKEYDMFSI